jgi:hypothetical protein
VKKFAGLRDVLMVLSLAGLDSDENVEARIVLNAIHNRYLYKSTASA